MKRRMLALILTLVLAMGLSTAAGAYTDRQLHAADALYHLNLFRGVSTTTKEYELDKGFKRFEGTILLLRMIGEEKDAETADATENPFADVTDWTAPYLTYAWKTGLVNGTSATTFAPGEPMSDYMFLTLVLRVLGYSDADGADFVWDNPYALAKRVDLIATAAADEEFTRGDAVLIFWKAMSAELKGTEETLAGRLMAQKVFSAVKYNEAEEIWTYGHVLEETESSGTSAPIPPLDNGEEDAEEWLSQLENSENTTGWN